MADYDPFFRPVDYIDTLLVWCSLCFTIFAYITLHHWQSKEVPQQQQQQQHTKKELTKYDLELFEEDYFEPPFDFITCTETAEHFKYPIEDFKKLFSPLLLNPSHGVSLIML